MVLLLLLKQIYVLGVHKALFLLYLFLRHLSILDCNIIMVKTVTETKFHASMYSYLLKISFTTPANLLLAVNCATQS